VAAQLPSDRSALPFGAICGDDELKLPSRFNFIADFVRRQPLGRGGLENID
jgi:hypothetical protein